MPSSFRIYQSFEEFEREELRPGSQFRRPVDDMMEDTMLEELNFEDMGGHTQRRGKWDDEDAEEEKEDEP